MDQFISLKPPIPTDSAAVFVRTSQATTPAWTIFQSIRAEPAFNSASGPCYVPSLQERRQPMVNSQLDLTNPPLIALSGQQMRSIQSELYSPATVLSEQMLL